ncbi:hypothetical protein DFH08DRAFT_817956 [Mycena albidolilacea]|uniref:Uncharacterized protein n=1 Tax=Mycena albidolilacea TaxID=1033008 RepID=A0AAD7EG69_9AGAR|nr:hypothetical protein DFH08DRAFT_817956 [Mycena albidolilacea]
MGTSIQEKKLNNKKSWVSSGSVQSRRDKLFLLFALIILWPAKQVCNKVEAADNNKDGNFVPEDVEDPPMKCKTAVKHRQGKNTTKPLTKVQWIDIGVPSSIQCLAKLCKVRKNFPLEWFTSEKKYGCWNFMKHSASLVLYILLLFVPTKQPDPS